MPLFQELLGFSPRRPCQTMGRRRPRPACWPNANEIEAASFTPDLISGVLDAPPMLAMEMADLILFKTATLTAFGLQRNGVWGEETALQKIEHLGLMFGALPDASAADRPI